MSNMVVRTNVFSLNAHRNMKNVGLDQGRASNRLSSGYRINSAADDAAGLAISETMRAQIRGLDQASRNAQDGQAMLLTTEGGLDEITNMLQRVRELLVQASNDTNTQDQRNMIEQEINQLGQEIGSMQQRVEFNTNRVLAMGPAMSSAISNEVAKIEADGIRVSEAFSLIDANRQAVADAREMLAAMPGTLTFDKLNDRQKGMIERAFAAVELDGVTGSVVTENGAGRNIPANIEAIKLELEALSADPNVNAIQAAALASVHIKNLVNDFNDAVEALGFATEGAVQDVADALAAIKGNANILDTAPAFKAASELSLSEIREVVANLGGTPADSDSLFGDLLSALDNLESHAQKVLDLGAELESVVLAAKSANVGSFDASGYWNDAVSALNDMLSGDISVEDLVKATNAGWRENLAAGVAEDNIAEAALKLAGNFDAAGTGLAANYQAASVALETARTALDVANAARLAAGNGVITGADDATATDAEKSAWRAVNDATYVPATGGSLNAYNAARILLVDALEATGLDIFNQVPTDTVTAMKGLLNDRETELAERTARLNEVRADMLTAAEVQFDAMNEFANAHTSGDFVAFFQVGANQNQGITFDFETVSRTVSSAAAVVQLASALVANPTGGGGVGRGIEVSPIIQQIQTSLDDVNRIRANLGAVQNRMDYTMRSLDISSENLQNSESRVRDADMAREMMRFTMANVLQQASISMLSQANQMPNNLLQILR